MKSSVHLFYGIIIGILICACTGSLKEDKAEFEEEKIVLLDDLSVACSKKMRELKEDGWTIIDVEIFQNLKGHTEFFAHIGR
tara:strand:- start:98 stop:343 length:246 start_codon:yes stop_codon:yes gene_type:complete